MIYVHKQFNTPTVIHIGLLQRPKKKNCNIQYIILYFEIITDNNLEDKQRLKIIMIL